MRRTRRSTRIRSRSTTSRKPRRDQSMRSRLINLLLPCVGLAAAVLIWTVASRAVHDLPSPMKTWQESKLYVLQPFEKRGEMDQGIGLLAGYSLLRVGRGYALGILLGTPIGFLLGL